MKLLVFAALVAVVSSASLSRNTRQNQQYQQDQDVQILRYDSDNDGLGNYNYAYEQSNGQKHEEQGELRNAGGEDESLVVRGQYSWVGPDGVTYIVTYIADDNGFQPTIEQGPGGGVPPAVVASLLG